MELIDALNRFANEPALIETESGRRWTYAELRAEVLGLAERLPERRSLAFCFCRNDAASVVRYLACLVRGHPVAMLAASMGAALKSELAARYEPALIFEPSGDAVRVREPASLARPHPQLAQLLCTSGTTGSPKFARLSLRNVDSNAGSIAQYLGLGPGERAITTLPIHYSYGLSVLNSHLLSGGCVALTRESLISPKFWKAFSEHGCTSLAGVPYSFEILARIGFADFSLPSLRTLTQAGGRLDPALVLKFDALMTWGGGRFFVMYGQTEATARMSYLPPESLPDKAGSVGVAVPGGGFSIQGPDGEAAVPGETGEIVYRGPNVMLGYAESPADLARGDELGGVLHTGDLGRFDDDGFLYVSGRRDRFSKIYGLRINLDDVEQRMRGRGPAAVVAVNEKIVVFCEYGSAGEHETLRRELAGLYKLNLNAFEFRKVPALPLKPSGKIDYAQLKV